MTDDVKILDVTLTMSLLRRAAAEKGWSYVDPGSEGNGCYNVKWDDEEGYVPSCIAGHVFYYAGVPVEFLNMHNGLSTNTAKAINNDDHINVKVTREGAVLLRAAQMVQDKAKSWGDAVDAAESLAQIFRSME